MLAIVVVLTLLSIAASCVLPLLWTRGEVVLREVRWRSEHSLLFVQSYREPALGMAYGMRQSGNPTVTWPDEKPWKNWLLHGWTPQSRVDVRGVWQRGWSAGTGWPMICAVAEGVAILNLPPSGPLLLTRKVRWETSAGVSDVTMSAFDQWPNSFYFPGLAINLLVHGLFWYLLVWLFAKGFKAFMPHPG